jgi:predicted MFS family arabinose efflux permease
MTLGQPLLRSLLIVVVIFNFFAPMLNAQFALFAVRLLGLTPLLLGLQIVVVGVCGVLAAFITGAVTKCLGMGPTMVLATLLISSGWLLVATLQRSWATTLPLMILGASIGTTGDVLININAATLRQLLTPDHLRGRVGASMRLFILGAQPLGALLGGVVGAMFGVRAAIFCAAGGFFLGFLSAFFSPLRELSQASVAVQPPSTTPLIAE